MENLMVDDKVIRWPEAIWFYEEIEEDEFTEKCIRCGEYDILDINEYCAFCNEEMTPTERRKENRNHTN